MAAKIITLNITRQTKSVSRAGFGTLMLMSMHKIYNERVRAYIATDDMLTDGFDSTDPEYLAAVAFLSANPNTGTILIGRQQADQAVVTVAAVENDTVYSVIINGTTFDITSDSDATNLEIIAALKTDIDAGAEPVTVVDNVDGTMDIDPDVAGTAFTITVIGTDLTITKPFTESETVLDAYTAIKAENSDFYGVCMTSRVQADVESIAAQILTEDRLFGTATSDAGTIAVTTTDVGAVLNAANNEEAWVLYSATQSSFPDVAWMSRQLAKDPGSSTWKFKTLIGQTTDNLTATQSTNATNKKVNTYETVGGIDMTLEGTVASGEFIDIIRGIHWLKARMVERIFTHLVNLEKIAGDDGGIAVIEGDVKAQLSDGVSVGLLTSDPAFVVTVPLASERSDADKLIRTLNDVKFTAYLQGAIHFVQIDGIVAV